MDSHYCIHIFRFTFIRINYFNFTYCNTNKISIYNADLFPCINIPLSTFIIKVTLEINNYIEITHIQMIVISNKFINQLIREFIIVVIYPYIYFLIRYYLLSSNCDLNSNLYFILNKITTYKLLPISLHAYIGLLLNNHRLKSRVYTNYYLT